MNRLHKLMTPALLAVLASSATGMASAQQTMTAPTGMPGMRTDCRSGHSIGHVRRHLDGTIDRLQHDRHDYQGHRVAAIADLQQARTELLAAEQFSVNTTHDSAGCFKAGGPTGGSDQNWGMRGQQGSNTNLMRVRHSIEVMIDNLQRDQRDYGGHRVAAIADLQRARAELEQARDVAPGMTPRPY